MTLKDMLDRGLELAEHPHPALRRRCLDVKEVDDDIRRLAAAMLEVMYELHGIGLAAAQVGVPLRVFVANPSGDPGRKELEEVFVNPVLLKGVGWVALPESCLSLLPLQNAELKVQRFAGVTLSWVGLDGAATSRQYATRSPDWDGVTAHVVQHELDHLDGVLFVDRLPAESMGYVEGALRYMQAQFDWKVGIGLSRSVGDLAAELDAFEAEYRRAAANIGVEHNGGGRVALVGDTQGGMRGPGGE